MPQSRTAVYTPIPLSFLPHAHPFIVARSRNNSLNHLRFESSYRHTTGRDNAAPGSALWQSSTSEGSSTSMTDLRWYKLVLYYYRNTPSSLARNCATVVRFVFVCTRNRRNGTLDPRLQVVRVYCIIACMLATRTQPHIEFGYYVLYQST